MPRATDILIILTYAMAAVVAALAFERFGLMGPAMAWIMGGVVFLIATQAHSAAARAAEKRAFETAIQEIRAANLSLAEELEAAQASIETLKEEIREGAANRDHALAGEVKVLEQLVRKLGAAARAAPAAAAAMPAGAPAGIETVRAALAENRVDLYLQPVVGLPQRKTYFYESYTRLRDPAGNIIPPAAFLAAAEEAGLVGEVDNLLLFRCVQIVRRLTRTDRRIGIFCNLSMHSMADEIFFPAFLDFIRRHKDLSGSLIFEISQAAFEARTPVAARNMARLADFGFRFSIDQIRDLNIDLAEMQRAGVRFAKIEGRRLVQALNDGERVAGREGGAIQPQDIAALFARYGVDLIAEKIEDEATVVEILDLDIAYGQGHLFGEPRPVKDEILDAAGEPQTRKSA